jgi:hypothetical protein
MNQRGIAGFVSACRNNRSISLYTTDFKCKVFRHSLALMNPSVVYFNSYPNDMDTKCRNGSVSYTFLIAPALTFWGAK